MSPSQRTMWEPAVRILNRNSVTVTLSVEPLRGRSRHSRRLTSGLPSGEKEALREPYT